MEKYWDLTNTFTQFKPTYKLIVYTFQIVEALIICKQAVQYINSALWW